MPHELHLFQALLRQHAQQKPDAVAVQGPVRRFTYWQLDEVELRVARLLSQPAGTFVMVLDNGPELRSWDLAALFAERTCVSVAPFFSAAQFRHCLQQSGATRVLRETQWTAQLLEQGFCDIYRYMQVFTNRCRTPSQHKSG
ncbi:AMP-binding protein [Pseudomonas sichuanensis]|uniref:AMP-binding protein n=1 Tax=Pseudomonas sichuanensis TaxID=2213015 RepID=UPI0037FCBB34